MVNGANKIVADQPEINQKYLEGRNFEMFYTLI